MAKKVTIQDIADALGLSRNTVSKAINNSGILAESTRRMVLNKAKEMGYKQFSYFDPAVLAKEEPAAAAPAVHPVKANIALFTAMLLDNAHFASSMLRTANEIFEQMGFHLVIYNLSAADIAARRLPPSFNLDSTAALVCVEIFNYDYAKMLCDLDLPVVFADAPVNNVMQPLNAALLEMDNRSGIYQFIGHAVSHGKKSFGYIGDVMHCQSFYERYSALNGACNYYGVSHSCIHNVTDNLPASDTIHTYKDYLTDSFRAMKEIPEVLVCANDFAAFDVINALHSLGYKVPDDVWICGFDDTQRSRYFTPRLTTIRINGAAMGRTLVDLITHLMERRDYSCKTFYVESELIMRESSGENPG